MSISFTKYHGAGNDFILIDNRTESFPGKNHQLIEHMCNRRTGIGADGLMLLECSEKYDFKMVYYNSDGHESTMCGNGGRCIVAFAQEMKVIDNSTTFEAIDGVHRADILPDNRVKLELTNVDEVETIDKDYYLNTGSPHYVAFRQELETFDVFTEGRKIRYNDRFKAVGTNVNFVEELEPNKIFVRTYERGVEDETLACGTGITASAISYAIKTNAPMSTVSIKALGGNLKVYFQRNGDRFNDVWLEGPFCRVFAGNYLL